MYFEIKTRDLVIIALLLMALGAAVGAGGLAIVKWLSQHLAWVS